MFTTFKRNPYGGGREFCRDLFFCGQAIYEMDIITFAIPFICVHARVLHDPFTVDGFTAIPVYFPGEWYAFVIYNDGA
jgi:hypothetical protein